MGGVLIRQAVGPVVAQRPEVVLGTEGQPHVAMSLEAGEVDKIGGPGHNCRQVRRMAAVDLHREVLGPMDRRRVAHILLPPVLTGPPHEMHSGICGLALRVHGVRDVPVSIIDCDVAVPDAGDSDELPENRKCQLRRDE